MLIFNPITNNKPIINKQSKKISFGVTNRNYRLNDYYLNKFMGTFTCLFRDDIDWLPFAKFIQELFRNKEKVNIIQFASSSGAEAYTTIISLLETGHSETTKKFFPIKAYDIDEVISNVAKSGFINLDKLEVDTFSQKNIDIQKYFIKNPQKLSLECGIYEAPQNTYVVKSILKENINFQVGDMFNLVKEINDKSNTIVLCRNSLAYFNQELKEKFMQDISAKLKKGSLFVIGNLDRDFGLLPLLEKYRFKQIMKNVYQKIDNSSKPIEGFVEKTQIPIWELLQKSRLHISKNKK